MEGSGDCQLTVVDLSPFLEAGDGSRPDLAPLCEAVARALQETGCLVVRDPRVRFEDNERFLDMMEAYFGQPAESKAADARPALSFQVGVTPEGTEQPRLLSDAAMLQEIQNLPPDHRPTIPIGRDVKERFFWRVGPRPPSTSFPELNAAPVVPSAFPQWAAVMDSWGSKMLAAVEAVAELAAVGMGLPRDAFVARMRCGPHLLAPTGSDLSAHGRLGEVYAGYHYDLNFLTVHGKSRFPGLFVWLRDGRRVPVRVPDGCLLVQAGKQLEWLTGGAVRAGMHEVVCTPATQAAAAVAAAAGRSTWRVSSTVFGHIASDEVLRPLGRFESEEARARYPAVPAGQYVQQELAAIRLKAADAPAAEGA